MEGQSLKKCPFCAEDINIQAIKCKHCQSELYDNYKKEQSKRLVTSEDSFLTRSRGCGDIVLYGSLFFVFLLFLIFLIKGCS